jgi:hypothetical protein
MEFMRILKELLRLYNEKPDIGRRAYFEHGKIYIESLGWPYS